MDLQLAGAHVLVTGGSKGIGLAVARAFLLEDARVTLVSRDRATQEAARIALADVAGTEIPAADAGPRIGIQTADLRDPASALAALDAAEAERWGGCWFQATRAALPATIVTTSPSIERKPSCAFATTLLPSSLVMRT